VERVILTNPTELSPSWEVYNHSATQEFPNILWNAKVYFRVQKSPALVLVMNQMNPDHISHHFVSLRSIIILSYLRLHGVVLN
jgi:hypothetical protein